MLGQANSMSCCNVQGVEFDWLHHALQHQAQHMVLQLHDQERDAILLRLPHAASQVSGTSHCMHAKVV